MRARVRVTTYAGSTVEAEGVFAGWGDQVAFERRFGQNAAVMGRLRDAFDDAGGLRADADPAAIRTEWLAFLAWRLFVRAGEAPASFDEWLEQIADLDLAVLEDSEGEQSADPTGALATPLPSS